MFKATEETNIHISKIMGELLGIWITYINSLDAPDLQKWENSINIPSSLKALNYLAIKQRATVEKYYNNLDFDELTESFEKFGSDTFPVDPLGPKTRKIK